MRALHVAVFARWDIGPERTGIGNASESPNSAHIRAVWRAPRADCVLDCARSLHRLALLHACQWQVALHLPASVGGKGVGPAGSAPASAHLPLHCALAVRAWLLAASTAQSPA